jgi:hypothetical protein
MSDRSTRDRIRASVPWWAKGALKLSLSRVPIHYYVRRALHLASHGAMRRPGYAYDVFMRHFTASAFHRKEAGGFTALELGPGDSLFSAMIAKAHGAATIWLVDIGRFACDDMQLYRNMARFLTDRGLRVPAGLDTSTIDKLCASCDTSYETQGFQSLRRLPSGSIDFIFSNAVLQAVRRDEFAPTLKELHRLTHPQGCNVHSIDLRDMMGLSLNHLRFSPRVWESKWVRESGFYTNRLRLAEILELCDDAGFESEVSELNRWPELPVNRTRLAKPFCDMPDEELLAATTRLVLRPRSQSLRTEDAR